MILAERELILSIDELEANEETYKQLNLLNKLRSVRG